MTYTPQTWVANTTVVSAARMNYIESGLTAAAAGGGGGVTKLYDSTVAGADAATIDTGAAGIAAGYVSLDIHLFAHTDGGGNTNPVYLQFNNDAAANYDWQNLQGAAGTATASKTDGDNGIQLTTVGGGATATTFSAYRITVFNYLDTTNRKTLTWTGGHEDPAIAGPLAQAGAASWRGTAAISRMAVVPVGGVRKLKIGSRLTIFGIG